jgi:hypothetical protein
MVSLKTTILMTTKMGACVARKIARMTICIVLRMKTDVRKEHFALNKMEKQ